MNKPRLEELEGYFTYLDGLRESGITNMFGAAPYLENHFGLPKVVAKKVLLAWMDSFDRDAPAKQRATACKWDSKN